MVRVARRPSGSRWEQVDWRRFDWIRLVDCELSPVENQIQFTVRGATKVSNGANTGRDQFVLGLERDAHHWSGLQSKRVPGILAVLRRVKGYRGVFCISRRSLAIPQTSFYLFRVLR